MPTYNGTSGNDTITAGAGGDTIEGGAGHDVINAGGGGGFITGGDGADNITSGSGTCFFMYMNISESNSTNGIDFITDFSNGSDYFYMYDLDYTNISSTASVGVLGVSYDAGNNRTVIESYEGDFEIHIAGNVVSQLDYTDFTF